MNHNSVDVYELSNMVQYIYITFIGKEIRTWNLNYVNIYHVSNDVKLLIMFLYNENMYK